MDVTPRWRGLLGCGLALFLLPACLQTPIGTDGPKTTSVIVDTLQQSAVDKIDLLFVVDNSVSMADKQEILALALPDLVERLVDPVCVASSGETVTATLGVCPQGYAREFEPVDDIHVGVITSSLGGFGAALDCTRADEGETDNAHLLGSLPRVQALGATAPFLRWCPPGGGSALSGDCEVSEESMSAEKFSADFALQVERAGEEGCGWEATLESWYRFLVEPRPWQSITRQNCGFANDTRRSCVGPELDPTTGEPLIDEQVLEQRRAFLRPDSLLAVVMLTDENDCSFKASGQSYRLSQSQIVSPEAALDADGTPQTVNYRAKKGTATCALSPNDTCCHSCGAAVPEGCPSVVNAAGKAVGSGCEDEYFPQPDPAEGSAAANFDHVNLRCFDQKRRFGVDYLYPTARYANALQQSSLCLRSDTLHPEAVAANGSRLCTPEELVPNPLYSDFSYQERLRQDPAALPIVPRSPSLVFLAGIVGVPWQDLAVDPAAAELVYRTNRAQSAATDAPTIDWNLLLGSAQPGAAYDRLTHPPGDPLMWEQVGERPGTDAAINGGEWNILDRSDLQYACTFPLEVPRDCPSAEASTQALNCDCTLYGDPAWANPLCNGLEQQFAKAYPSIRPLQVLRDFGQNSIVASICPKQTADRFAKDFGYRPAMVAIVERLKEQLRDKCLTRQLKVENGQVRCKIVEADPTAAPGAVCEGVRHEAEAGVQAEVQKRLRGTGLCSDALGNCDDFKLCEITPLSPGTPEYQSCLAAEEPLGDGWCYVDPAQGLGDKQQVEQCAASAQQKIRFAGQGKPRNGTTAFFACTGAPLSELP
jgi:hypothetical protein